MVQFVLKSYPYVKKLHFEHVTSTDNDKTFYDAFINSFIEAQRIGRENGIDVYCSGSRGIAKIKYSFCRGEFCLTPTGEIVACHRVSSKEDKAFGLYKYAEVKNGSVLIDSSKKKSVEEYFYGNHSECKTCFAKWHCAGSCPTERSVYSDEMMELKCYFTKGLTKALLVEQLNRHVSI